MGCKTYTLLTLMVLIFFGIAASSTVAGNSTLDDPDVYARVVQEQLIIGNSLIEYIFNTNDNRLALSSIEDKETGAVLHFSEGNSLFGFGSETDSCLYVDISHIPYKPINRQSGSLQTTLTYTYANLLVKQIISIYPKTRALQFDYLLKSLPGTLNFSADEVVLFQASMQTPHWHYTAIEFFDQTDIQNTLTQKSQVLGYSRPTSMRGNVIIMEDLSDKLFLWMLKKAPCSGVQLYYPGYDFNVSRNHFQLIGGGILPDDLTPDEWTPVYGCVLGSPSNSELSLLKDMRIFHKNHHFSDPESLEMVMMNTWGDRNRDASISEEFIMQEIDASNMLGITHFQIDDGWQQGKSMNSAEASGNLWESWTYEDWQPARERFPNGFSKVIDYANNNGISLGLWFNPSRTNDYASWETDAKIVSGLYKDYGIRFFKIDGIEIPTKRAELNLRKFYQSVQEATDYQVVFNIDATAGRRGGYFYLQEYGNIFLENRYTDWGNYYPYQTLRNLWMLASYVPPEKLQIEFLNIWRNDDKYPHDDPFKPSSVPFDYVFAIAMMAQPLAWLEGSSLPHEAYEISSLIKQYTQIQNDLHSGIILPIGDEPNGRSWTGFQSIRDKEGYLLIFRENNHIESELIKTHGLENKHLHFELLAGHGKSFSATADAGGGILFSLNMAHSFALYKYRIEESGDGHSKKH
jgi:alpha-galactosidase